MKKRLIQHGNSSALVIDKPILELLHITQDTMLDVKTDGKSLIITPIDQKLVLALNQVNKKQGRVLKKLAK